MMKAILLKGFGGVEQLYVGSCSKPQVKLTSLLIKVKAAGVNRADLQQRQGHYPPPPGASEILGLEIAGVVEEAGEEAKSNGWKQGERICGIITGGAYAEYAEIHYSHAIRIPEKFSFEEAAAVPEAFLTAYQALHLLGGLKPGANQDVLVHAAGSGVGTAALQLCKIAKARHVIGTAGSKEKLDALTQFGATHGINYKDGGFSGKVLEITEKKGVNIALDFIGATNFNENLKSLALEGVLTMQGSLGGMKTSEVDLAPILRNRLQIKGSTLRARSDEYKANLVKEFVAYAIPHLESGELKPVISKTFKWEDVASAHQFVADSQNIGKVILNGFP